MSSRKRNRSRLLINRADYSDRHAPTLDRFSTVSGKFRVNLSDRIARRHLTAQRFALPFPIPFPYKNRSIGYLTSFHAWPPSLDFDCFVRDLADGSPRGEKAKGTRWSWRVIQPRETGSGQVTGHKRDPIIRSGLRRADRGRGYHKSRLTVGKIFAARATGRGFRFFTLFEYTACTCTR